MRPNAVGALPYNSPTLGSSAFHRGRQEERPILTGNCLLHCTSSPLFFFYARFNGNEQQGFLSSRPFGESSHAPGLICGVVRSPGPQCQCHCTHHGKKTHGLAHPQGRFVRTFVTSARNVAPRRYATKCTAQQTSPSSIRGHTASWRELLPCHPLVRTVSSL